MYELIYSVADDSSAWTFALLGLMPIGVGLIFRRARLSSALLHRRGAWYPVSFIIGGCVWFLVAFVEAMSSRALGKALEAG